MFGSLLSAALCLLLMLGVYVAESLRWDAWLRECVALFAEVPDLHPAEAARRARKLLAEKPQEWF